MEVAKLDLFLMSLYRPLLFSGSGQVRKSWKGVYFKKVEDNFRKSRKKE